MANFNWTSGEGVPPLITPMQEVGEKLKKWRHYVYANNLSGSWLNEMTFDKDLNYTLNGRIIDIGQHELVPRIEVVSPEPQAEEGDRIAGPPESGIFFRYQHGEWAQFDTNYDSDYMFRNKLAKIMSKYFLVINSLLIVVLSFDLISIPINVWYF